MKEKKVGEFIAKCRKDKNLTQEQLADSVGVTGASISKWENGRNLTDTIYFDALSNELGVSVLELMNGERFPEDSVPASSLNKALEECLSTYKIKERKKRHKIISILTVIFLILMLSLFLLFYINNYNKFRIYSLTSDDLMYNASGVLSITNEKNLLMISGLECNGCDDIKIYDAEIRLYVGEKMIYKEGDISNYKKNDGKYDNLNQFLHSIFINIQEEKNNSEYVLESIEKNQLILIINYIDEDEMEYNGTVLFKLLENASSSKILY